MKTFGRILIATFFIVMLIIAIKNGYKRYSDNKVLLNSNQLTWGRIIDFGRLSGRTGGKDVGYYFELGDRKYDGRFRRRRFCRIPQGKEELIVKNAYIPVIYVPSKPEINKMLLSEVEYAKYNIPYPDSIRSLLKEFFDCK